MAILEKNPKPFFFQKYTSQNNNTHLILILILIKPKQQQRSLSVSLSAFLTENKKTRGLPFRA